MSNGRLKFFKLVKELREAQKEYFSTRSSASLARAKQLEARVDACIKRGDDYIQQHPTLFND